jgi:hypothetical protein
VATLVIGLLGFVFIATLIYVIAGPDSAPAQVQTGPAIAQIPAAGTGMSGTTADAGTPDRRTTPAG